MVVKPAADLMDELPISDVPVLEPPPDLMGDESPAPELSPESAHQGTVSTTAESRRQSEMTALFTLSTQDVPTIPFDVNGTRYELRTMAHLSPEEESEVRYLFRRDDELSTEFNKLPGKDRDKLLSTNNKLRDIRVKIILMMSDMPEDVVREFKLHHFNKILRYIGRDPEDVLRESAENSGEDIRQS